MTDIKVLESLGDDDGHCPSMEEREREQEMKSIKLLIQKLLHLQFVIVHQDGGMLLLST